MRYQLYHGSITCHLHTPMLPKQLKSQDTQLAQVANFAIYWALLITLCA